MIVPRGVTDYLTAQQTTRSYREIFPSRETYEWRENCARGEWEVESSIAPKIYIEK
jgi:hypothetical protein